MRTPELLAGDGIGVHQRRKFFELVTEYTLVDATGTTVGTVTQVRQTVLALLARILSSLDVVLATTLEVRDAAGALVLTLHKPWFTWRVDVHLADGTEVGAITKRLRLGKARFELAGPGGVPVGDVLARNWRARDFAVHDGAGQHVAEVTKQWRGLLTEAFTDADSYAVTFTPAAVEPVRTLAFASALAVDVLMKQKDTG